jgi:hypothetical protein
VELVTLPDEKFCQVFFEDLLLGKCQMTLSLLVLQDQI